MDISCTICLTSMTSSDELLGTLCGHVCHSACMIDWLKRSQTCPQCRRVIHHRDIGRIYLNFTNSDNSLMESVLNNHQSELDHLQSVLQRKTDIIANYEQQLKHFPVILLQRDQELQEKAASIANYQKQLKDFPGILLQKDQELQEKAASIAKYEKQLKDFPDILLQKDRELQEKAASIAVCQTQLKGLNKILELRDLQLQQKSKIIADHQRELKELLSLVQQFDQQIKQNDQQMQQRDQQIKQRDQQMQQNAAIIADQKRELENLLSLVQQRNQQLQEKTAIIGNLENEIKKKDQNNTDQITVVENLKKQIEADQRYFQPQLALQQARILELEMRNQLTSGQVVAETKRVTLESEKCIILEECVEELTKKLSDERAKSSNLEQHLSMCDRQKLELQARLDSLEKQLELKEEKTKKASQSNTKKRTANVSSNVKSEPNLVQPKVEPNASGSKTQKRAARAPLGTINQNSEQSRYNLRPR